MEEIRRSPAEVGSLSHYLQGFIHPRWLFGISSTNSMKRYLLPPKVKLVVGKLEIVQGSLGAFLKCLIYHTPRKPQSTKKLAMYQLYLALVPEFHGSKPTFFRHVWDVSHNIPHSTTCYPIWMFPKIMIPPNHPF